MYKEVIDYIRSLYGEDGFIPLHEPRFPGREKEYLNRCIDSTFVSYIGEFVRDFEEKLNEIAGTDHAVAMVNGTAALQMGLKGLGVGEGDEVITQPLTFVASSNAIKHVGGDPVYVDIEEETLGMDPDKLLAYLKKNAAVKEGEGTFNKKTGNRIAACLPVHIHGHPCRIEEIVKVCATFGIPVIEDAAESIGSKKNGKHTGSFGKCGVFSFNGNKTVTCGGGGAVVTNDKDLAERLNYLSTTAKRPGKAYIHDEVGYNFRMPNLNAAVACAQLEKLGDFVANKRETASLYHEFFSNKGIHHFQEPEDCYSNYWLNTLLFPSMDERTQFLKETEEQDIMTRPVWELMHHLKMFKDAEKDETPVAEDLAPRAVNIPSSVRI